MQMKKLSLVVSVFLVVFILTGKASSSSFVTYSGTYENKHIQLSAFNSIASWFSQNGGGSSSRIKFTIMAKPGYKLIGKHNRIVYYGIHFTFKPKSNKSSYKKAFAYASGWFIKSAVFKLRYSITNGTKKSFVTKKLRMIMERRARGSHDNVKMIIEEI